MRRRTFGCRGALRANNSLVTGHTSLPGSRTSALFLRGNRGRIISLYRYYYYYYTCMYHFIPMLYRPGTMRARWYTATSGWPPVSNNVRWPRTRRGVITCYARSAGQRRRSSRFGGGGNGRRVRGSAATVLLSREPALQAVRPSPPPSAGWLRRVHRACHNQYVENNPG